MKTDTTLDVQVSTKAVGTPQNKLIVILLSLYILFNYIPFQVTYDQGGYIKDMVSEMRFDVNDEFLDYLYNTHGIETNPENGDFNFDLECTIEQGANGEYNSESIRTRFNVKRVYAR